MTKILAGGPARDDTSPLFNAWKRCLTAQKGVDIDFRYKVDTDQNPDTVRDTHVWDVNSFERVAKLRQSFFCAFNKDLSYDYLLMVDDDILIDDTTVQTLIRELQYHQAHVAYGVFWTVWGEGIPPLPQVWDEQPYGHRDPDLLTRLYNRETMIVRGGGACTLFDRTATEQCRYHPRIESLPMREMWQGEDRTFALCCEVRKIKQIAVAAPRIVHLYKPSMRTPKMIQVGLRMAGYED